MNTMDRRDFLKLAGTAVAAAAAPWPLPAVASAPRKIAALATTYHVRSHADNFITRFLEGYWINDRYYPPPCRVASLYVEQEHPADISDRLARSWGVARYPTIREALTLGGDTLAVDGVLLIAEHGDYPTNVKNQKLYPRYQYMEEIVKVFRHSGRAVPVFNDKQLSYDWDQSRQMVDWSRELGFPFMAGSSVSVTFRRPELDFPLETPLEEAMAVGGGWVADGGLFHLLETLQCFAERRKGGETGVKAVQLLADDAVWKAADEGRFSRNLLEAALSRGARVMPGSVEATARQPVACLVEYSDGFRGSALALGGKASEYLAAVRIEGQPAPRSTLCYIPIENSNNFSPLVDSIGRMFTRGTLDYPVERTLLTSGALSLLMESWHRGQDRVETPMLNIAYRAPEASYYARGRGS
ncbi:MAG: twin-arginine translocation signal domain-containing protein [Acidobacteriota bacterium]|nr:twin-arginine translocation signal domain-containing protein [Acidobacteriota bacterium]